MNTESMSLSDLKAMLAKVEKAIPIAEKREKAAFLVEVKAIADKHGLDLNDLLAAPPKNPTKAKRKSNLTRMVDKKTGVVWAGAGRYPPNFLKSRAEAVR